MLANLRKMLALGAFFLFLAVPAILVIKPAPQNFGLSWALSIGLMAVFVFTLRDGGWAKRLAVIALTTLFALMNIALAVSFVMQGTAFNAAFLAHLDLSTLDIALKTDAARMLMAALYVLAVPFVAWAVITRKRGHSHLRRRGGVFKGVVLILALMLSYPLQSVALLYYTTTKSSARLNDEIANLNIQRPQGQVEVEDARNIVLVYLEGLEQNYHDESLFPGLMPHLNAEKPGALWFNNMHQFPGSEWTIGGIVSTQCGVPLLSEGRGNRILASVDNPFRHVTCLAEFLHDAGYRTAYLGGATLEFAGKGKFLRDNGYDVALGVDELPNSSGHTWGMYDRDLFGHATSLFDGLAEGESPFMLTMLTLDTHHPSGTPSPGCAPYGGRDYRMLHAVHCTDQLLADFIAHIRASKVAEDTIIVLVSDHLLIHGSVKPDLEKKPRRITFMVLDSDEPGRVVDGAGTHFDVGPTVLDLAGINNAEFAFGQSLLSHAQGKAFARHLTRDDFARFKIENLAVKTELRLGVRYDRDEGIVKVGRTTFQAADGKAARAANDALFDRGAGQFIAMYFSSVEDGYPDLYWSAYELMTDTAGMDEGYIVAASDGPELCVTPEECASGPYLLMRDLAAGKTLLRTEELSLSPAEVSGFIRP